MDTIGKRINYFLEKEKISVNEFSEKTGISTNMIYRLKSDERGLSSSSLARILEAYPDFDIKWLITGITSQPENSTSQLPLVNEKDGNYYDDSLKKKVKMIIENEIVLDTFVEMIKKYNENGKNYDL